MERCVTVHSLLQSLHEFETRKLHRLSLPVLFLESKRKPNSAYIAPAQGLLFSIQPGGSRRVADFLRRPQNAHRKMPTAPNDHSMYDSRAVPLGTCTLGSYNLLWRSSHDSAGQLDDAGGINLPRSDFRAIKSQLSANELEKIRRRREPYFRSARNHMRRFAVVFALRSM